MERYTDGSVRLDKWDVRAIFELMKEGTGKISDAQLEEKRGEITSGFLRRLKYGLKHPLIRVQKSEGEKWVKL